jgi:hypothetical protein
MADVICSIEDIKIMKIDEYDARSPTPANENLGPPEPAPQTLTPEPRAAARKRQPIIEPVRGTHHRFAAAIEAEPGGRMYYPRATETLVAMGFKPTTRSKYMTMLCRYLGFRRGWDENGAFIEKTSVVETMEGGDVE